MPAKAAGLFRRAVAGSVDTGAPVRQPCVQEGEVMSDIVEVKAKHRGMLLALPNVVGVGVGKRITGRQPSSEMAIIVFVSRKVPDAELKESERIPRQLDGIPLDVQVQAALEAR